MLGQRLEKPGYVILAVFGVIAPMVFPAYVQQIAMLWIMIVFALTWDTMGGQMGYNSLGNIFFFGAGMYIAAVCQIWPWYDVGEYTDPSGILTTSFTPDQYFAGLALGIVLAALGSVVLAIVFGAIVFGLRGPYFAIGTLGLAIAAGELIGAWDWVGGGGGIRLPVFPSGTDADPLFRVPFGDIQSADLQGVFFYWTCFVLAVADLPVPALALPHPLRLMLNAIRDDETKAEALGVRTQLYKTVAWSISAFFLGISGALFGNIIGFMEPLEVAFPTVTFGIFMVLMALLGGKGTLWGPVIGATLFHIIKEVTWTYLLGWQWVVLGLLIVATVVFFQQGHRRLASGAAPRMVRHRVDRGTAGQRADAETADALEAALDETDGPAGEAADDRPDRGRKRFQILRRRRCQQRHRLDVEEGSITGLIGPNGSGKTTLFNSIVGFHPIDSGSIRFEGREISKMRVPQIARLGMLRTFQQTRSSASSTASRTCTLRSRTAAAPSAACSRASPARPRSGRRACWISSACIRSENCAPATCPSASRSCSNSPWR